MVRSRLVTGWAVASPLRVGVVSTDYRLRGFYRGLAVAPFRGAGGEPLRSVVPAATVGPGGRLSVVDGENGHWSTAFVRSVAEAESLGVLDLLVVDLPVFDVDRLCRMTAPTVVIAKDPADPAVTRLAETMPVFGYDGLLRGGRDRDASGSFPRLENRRDRVVRVLLVTAPAVCANAGLFWGDVASLVRLGRRSPYVAALVREAFGLFHDLLGLAMPVEEFAGLTDKPLRARVSAFARAAEIVSDTELRDDWLPMAEAELAGLLDALRSTDGDVRVHDRGPGNKATALIAVLAEALDDRRDVVLIARTAALARAYTEYLQGRGLGGVRVTSLGALAGTRPGDLAVLLGIAPSWGTWVYRAGLGRELLVLAYTPDAPATASCPSGYGEPAAPYGSGFDEAEMVTSAVRRQTEAGERISAPTQRARSWSAVVNGTRPGPLAGRGGDSARSGADVVLVSVPRPPEVPPGLWDGTGWMAPLEPGGSGEPTRTRDVAETGPGLRVTFTDGSWAWLHHRSPVWRWRRHAGRSEQVDPADLAVGNEVIFIDGDAHMSLVAKILDVAEGVPALALAAGWHERWQAVLHRAHARFGSYTALHRELSRLGCRVQAQTVRLWCVGVTIGPDDREDVRRLGTLMDDPVLSGKAAEIWRAMQTLRNSHGRASRRLDALARVLGPAVGNAHLPADEVIDPVSGLTAADLHSAVVLVTVAGIDAVAVVPRVLTGRRRAADEAADVFIPTTPPESEYPS